MNENQLFEPSYLNKFVTEAYTTSVGKVEYIQILSEFPKIQDSQDILLNSLSYQDLTEYTIIYIIKSLNDIFSHNKSIINNYISIFKDFFLNIFPRYPRKPAITNEASSLFVVIFRENREVAKNVLLNIKDSYIASIFSSNFVAATKSMACFSIFFEKVLSSFTNQNSESIQNFQLFSQMLKAFKPENVPSQLIDLIIQIGGPKNILNAINFMNIESASEFLLSLDVIINLPIEVFKMEPVRLKYLIEFIEGTVELIRNFKDLRIISALSFISLELRNSPPIRSLKKIDFLILWINEIFQITNYILNSDFLNAFPSSFENWINFWSLLYDFQSFRENYEFKTFSLNLIEKVIDPLFSFLIENSSQISEHFIRDDASSNLFEYISKMCQVNYSKMANTICDPFIKNGIDEIFWRIEFSSKLINSHSNSTESLNFIFDDIKLLNCFQNISQSIQCNSEPLFEYLLISLFQSFLNSYGTSRSKSIEKILLENLNLLIYYIMRTVENLFIPNLPDRSIRLFVNIFKLKYYSQSILNQIIEKSDIIQKVIEMNFPFCYEKDKKVEAKNFYSYFFTLLQNDKAKISMSLETLLSKINSIDSIQYVLNISVQLFESFEKNNVDLIYSYFFDRFVPVISHFASIQIEEENFALFHHLAKFLSTIANACETKNHFKYMSPFILNLFKSTSDLMLTLIKNSGCNEKVMYIAIMAINSFIKNNSLNIGIMMVYNDFTFNQFLIEFLNFLNSKNEIFNQKLILNLFNLFELILCDFNVLQQPYYDLFLFLINQVIVRSIPSFNSKCIFQCISILNRSFHLFEHLKEDNENLINDLLCAFLSILPNIKTNNIDVCLLYLNLFILTKSFVIQKIEFITSNVLEKNRYGCLMQTLAELLDMPSINNKTYSSNREKYQKMLDYIRESLIRSSVAIL